MTDLRPHLRQLQADAIAMLREHWRERFFLALIVLVPLLLLGIYQVRLGQTIHLGVPPEDRPYIVGPNAPEQAALFALVGLLLNVYVRYAYYLLPVIAIGAGLTLARLTMLPRRLRPWGQIAAALLLTGTITYGLWFWYLRISVAGH